jgi:hypothetical protein
VEERPYSAVVNLAANGLTLVVVPKPGTLALFLSGGLGPPACT